MKINFINNFGHFSFCLLSKKFIIFKYRRLAIPRKHLIANATNKKQQLQAKILLKLAREIKVAVKVGGPNPESNARLKAAISKALQNNL